MQLTTGWIIPEARGGVHLEYFPKGKAGAWLFALYFPKPTCEGRWTCAEYIDLAPLCRPSTYSFATLYLWSFYVGLSFRPPTPITP